MSTHTDSADAVAAAARHFDRVLVGIDGSPEALEAARQAAWVLNPDGSLTLLTAWSLEPPLVTIPPDDASDGAAARLAAETAARAAELEHPSARSLVMHGMPGQALIEEIDRSQATLVAVGSHGTGRATGILVGSTATRLVHEAPCSVLIARGSGGTVARRIAVGVDGSPESAAAYAAARHLAEKSDADLTVVVAEADELLDLAAVSQVAGDGFHVIPDAPTRVLAAASADTDLLVVGSRGLRGLKALGSVSERVAHRADCSVLIVR